MKSNKKKKKVFKNYSQKMGRDQSYFRFMYDGRSIGQDDTPESVRDEVLGLLCSWVWKITTVLIVNWSRLVVIRDLICLFQFLIFHMTFFLQS